MTRLTKKISGFVPNNAQKYRNSENITHKQVIDKLGKLEDIEEELGIDLITLFKAFRYGIYVKTHKYNDYVSPQDLRGTLGWEYILDFANKEDHSHPYEVKLIFGRTGICLTSRSYCKTWALTKEELENNRIANVIDKAVETATNRVIEREALEIIKKHGLSQPHLNLILQSENYGLYRRIIVGSHNDVFKYEIPYSRDEFELIKAAFRIEE